MKKETFFLIACILLLTLVSAAPTPPETPAQSTISDMPNDTTNPVPTPASAFEEVKLKSNEYTNQEIHIPSIIQPLTKGLLKIDDTIPLDSLIVTFAVCILLILVFHDAFHLFGPFREGTSIAMALVITLVAGVTGIIKQIALSLLAGGKYIKAFNEWSAGIFILSLIVLFLILTIWRAVTRKIKHAKEKAEKTEEGIEIGTNLGMLGWISKAFERVASSSGKYSVEKTDSERKKQGFIIVVIIVALILLASYIILYYFTH